MDAKRSLVHNWMMKAQLHSYMIKVSKQELDAIVRHRRAK